MTLGLGRLCHTAPLAVRYLNELVQQDLVIFVYYNILLRCVKLFDFALAFVLLHHHETGLLEHLARL